MDSRTRDDRVASSDGPPRALLIAALVLAVGTVGIILAIAATRRAPQQPVAIPAAFAPHAQDPACRALLNALPQRLGDYQRAPAAQPSPPGAAAWRAPRHSAPIVLRCGLDRPADFVVGAPIQVVDRVQWFEESEPESGGEAGRSTWYAVDRPVYVALTLPAGSGPTPIQQLSDLIDRTITAVPISPAPAR
ncbi:MAG: DUF3515 domain-containing protein [Mycobacterium sp.]|nr:DUF3515 domain-containing protein [Mycobacterium sp.]